MTRDALLEQLHTTFGFTAFRGVQAQVLARVMAGQSTLAIMPTGAGKSLTYQLPAVMLEGTCVVVSPLIALMHDQLRGATANGIRAATLTSADLDRAESHYEQALRINPKHRGALEYSGELHLTRGDLAKAEQRLAALNKACFLPCEEYTELKAAIEAHKRKAGGKS